MEGKFQMLKVYEIYLQAVANLTAQLEAKKGQGLVEYVLIVALISVVAIAIMTTVGDQVVAVFSAVADALSI